MMRSAPWLGFATVPATASAGMPYRPERASPICCLFPAPTVFRWRIPGLAGLESSRGRPPVKTLECPASRVKPRRSDYAEHDQFQSVYPGSVTCDNAAHPIATRAS